MNAQERLLADRLHSWNALGISGELWGGMDEMARSRVVASLDEVETEILRERGERCAAQLLGLRASSIHLKITETVSEFSHGETMVVSLRVPGIDPEPSSATCRSTDFVVIAAERFLRLQILRWQDPERGPPASLGHLIDRRSRPRWVPAPRAIPVQVLREGPSEPPVHLRDLTTQGLSVYLGEAAGFEVGDPISLSLQLPRESRDCTIGGVIRHLGADEHGRFAGISVDPERTETHLQLGARIEELVWSDLVSTP